MQIMNKFEILSTRESFNTVVRHIKATMGLAEGVSAKGNLADLVIEAGSTQDLTSEQVSAFLGMLLVDKYGYTAVSKNLDAVSDKFQDLSTEIQKWNAVDLVFAYHHPDVGLVLANPKNSEQMNAISALRKRELLVVYAGYQDKKADEMCTLAANTLISLVEGANLKPSSKLYTGAYKYKAPIKKAVKTPASASKGKKSKTANAKKTRSKASVTTAASSSPVKAQEVPAPVSQVSSGRRRMTPMYSVVVQNELFHNGNVEAWKRIVASYKTKYPDLEVYIYYDGERIVDINSLFKWGKVKHGSCIQFAIAGSDIKDVAKLQRYLSQGASHMFESFLHGPVSTVLKLF